MNICKYCKWADVCDHPSCDDDEDIEGIVVCTSFDSDEVEVGEIALGSLVYRFPNTPEWREAYKLIVEAAKEMKDEGDTDWGDALIVTPPETDFNQGN